WILRREGRVVRRDAPSNAVRGDVRLDLLVEIEMVLLGDDVDLGAGRCFPFRDARVERLILLAADQLGVDGDAVELAGQLLGDGRTCSQCHEQGTGATAGPQS